MKLSGNKLIRINKKYMYYFYYCNNVICIKQYKRITALSSFLFFSLCDCIDQFLVPTEVVSSGVGYFNVLTVLRVNHAAYTINFGGIIMG